MHFSFTRYVGMISMCLATAFSANAAVVSASGKITRIATAHGGEGVHISINATVTSSCPSNTQFIVPISSAVYKDMVAIALASRAQNSTITIFYDNAVCPNGYSPTAIALSDTTW